MRPLLISIPCWPPLLGLRFAVIAGLLAFALAAGGCSRSDRPKTVKVHGRVTLNGGDWPNQGISLIAFHTIQPAEGYIGRPGQAQFDESGSFTAGTYEADDGLVPGEYDVRVTFEKRRSGASEEAAPELFIEGHDRLVVPADDNSPIEYHFDVRSNVRK